MVNKQMTSNQIYNVAWVGHIKLRVWLKECYPELSYDKLWEVMVKIKEEDESELDYEKIVNEAKVAISGKGPIILWIKENYPNANLAKVKI